jgi:hypothetical protein
LVRFAAWGTIMDYLQQIGFALLLGMPVASIVWTFTQEEIFRECRDSLKAFQQHHSSSLLCQKLAYMPLCPYCLSHYVAAVFVALLRFRMLADDWRGYVVSLFTLVLIANLYVTLYNLLRVNLRAAKAAADRVESEDLSRLETPDTAAAVASKQFPAVAEGTRRPA